MKIVFDDVTLADYDDALVRGLNVGGEIAWEAIDIVRAAAKKLHARGNQVVSYSFSVRREFDSIEDAEVFLTTHFSLLPKAGLCVIYCGLSAADNTPVYLANALLTASPSGTYQGLSVTVSYTIVAAVAATDAPPDILLAESMIKRGSEPIANAADEVEVEFDEPFDVEPIVVVTVTKAAAGDDNLSATLRKGSVTVNGFTVDLTAPAGAADTYTLDWIAVPSE